MPDSPVTSTARARLRVKNALAAVALTWAACLLYAAAPWNRAQMRDWHAAAGLAFNGRDFLLAAAAVYSLALVVWMLSERTPHTGKSLRFVALM